MENSNQVPPAISFLQVTLPQHKKSKSNHNSSQLNKMCKKSGNSSVNNDFSKTENKQAVIQFISDFYELAGY